MSRVGITEFNSSGSETQIWWREYFNNHFKSVRDSVKLIIWNKNQQIKKRQSVRTIYYHYYWIHSSCAVWFV